MKKSYTIIEMLIKSRSNTEFRKCLIIYENKEKILNT